MSNLSRRHFFSYMGMGAGAVLATACGQSSLVTTPLDSFYSQSALGFTPKGEGFGPLIPTLPENMEHLKALGKGRLARRLLAIPRGFKYTAISITSERMSDSARVPSSHDGMACFDLFGEGYILVRNHEISTFSPFGILSTQVPKYDVAAYGGTTTLIVGTDGQLRQDFISLAGTIRNCAGGPTPWRTWLSCEETTLTPTENPRLNRKHGYVFEVPVGASATSAAIPLTAMGRFNHEAVAVDPDTGYIYETEDNSNGCFYRFRPHSPGNLSSGGILEALKPVGATQVINTSSAGYGKGEPIPVEWVEISDPDPDTDTVAVQAQAQNAAIFRRGEGAWYGNGLIYFVCTTGGAAGQGQVWSYNPDSEILMLVVESTGETELDNPDNITVGPDGSLYLCEDGDDAQYVVGVTPDGELFPFVLNLLDQREFAGGCFSPDGKKFFVNGQGVGITYCIWRQDDQPIVLDL
jgi:hypothetical protein